MDSLKSTTRSVLWPLEELRERAAGRPSIRLDQTPGLSRLYLRTVGEIFAVNARSSLFATLETRGNQHNFCDCGAKSKPIAQGWRGVNLVEGRSAGSRDVIVRLQVHSHVIKVNNHRVLASWSRD